VENALQGIVSKGLEAGSQLVLTPLGQVSSGTPVQIMDATPKAQKTGEQP